MLFFASRRRHTRYWRDWSSDVCSSDLARLHQVSPTAATTATARATPATTLATRCSPLSRVLVRVACTTSSAVSAAMIGGGSCSPTSWARSEEHTSELQSRQYLVCRLLLEKKKN